MNGDAIGKSALHHDELEKYLPVKKVHSTSKLIFLQTFRFKADNMGIIGANWEHPFIENDHYFLFIGGHVLNRISETNGIKQIVPAPKDILQTLLKMGDSHYKVLKGNYYCLLFDKIEKNIMIYSSPMFLYPVYFYLKSGFLIFSNILEFVLNEARPISINKQGMAEFTLFDHTIGMDTIYKNIFTIPGGTKIEIREGRIRETIVYDLSSWIHESPLSRKRMLPAINNILNVVIRNYTENVPKFNLSLTGGFDGRLNLSIINPSDYKRMQTFSYGKSGSLQLIIPEQISKKVGFNYKPVCLDKEFVEQYASLGYETIILSSGLTPFTRANYLYGYEKILKFSRNCILGQCDMIRPLYTNPAGSIFNKYSQNIFFKNKIENFLDDCNQLKENGFLKSDTLTQEIAEEVYFHVNDRYIKNYKQFNDKERFFLFLYKESIMKYWQTECHVVDLLVDDFISFADLDYLEALSASEYFGLYKGIFASNQFKRRKAHDLYIDLMTLNNDKLNDFVTDRMFKPKWLKYGFLGYIIAALSKIQTDRRTRRVGNDTFGGLAWSDKFYAKFETELKKESDYFCIENLLNNRPYSDDNHYRRDRHSSLKLWLDHIGIR